MNREEYKEERLDICPDCGGNLEGIYCDECKSKWIFAEERKGVEHE